MYASDMPMKGAWFESLLGCPLLTKVLMVSCGFLSSLHRPFHLLLYLSKSLYGCMVE
jgi:hypothetical protein